MLNVLLFICSYIGGFILSFSASPVFAFVLYEVVYFFYPQKRWWGYMLPDVSYSYSVVVLMFVVFLSKFKLHSENKLLSAPQFKWIFLYLFTYFIALFYAVFPILHQEFLITYLKLIIIISIAYKLIDSELKLKYTLWGYIFGSWYVSFIAYQVGRNSGSRVEGIGTVDSAESNGIAAAIAPSLVLCLYYFWQSNHKLAKLAFAFAGAFIANAIVLINSRGAFLGVAISMMYFMYFMYFSSFQVRLQKATAVWVTIAGLSGVLYLADNTFIERMYTIQTTEVSSEQEGGATRTAFWLAAWDMAKDHPFGAGFRGFNYYANAYISQEINTGASRNRSVHSSWFESLSEVGYLGLLFIVMMIYSSFKSTYLCKSILKEKQNFPAYFKIIAIEASLIAYIIAMSFINRSRAEIFYWLILYTACAYNIYVLKDQNTQVNNMKS